jgi:hypothetical protein
MAPTNPPGGNTTPLLPEVADALAKAKAKTETETEAAEDWRRRRTSAIDTKLRQQARTIAFCMVKFKELIVQAKEQRIHETLGFLSWTDYIADVVAKEMGQLPVDDRRQIVVLLAGEGMSNREIAGAVGVSHPTVIRDKAAMEPEVVHDVPPGYGKPNPAKQKPKPDVPAPKPSNTFVGRFYKALSPLMDHALRLDNLTQNKEFPANVDEVCRGHRDSVEWVQEVITRVLDRMHSDQIDLLAGSDRPGVTRYSQAIQGISASITEAHAALTDEQIAEALGAAQHLYELLRGFTIIRQRGGDT